MVTFSAVKRVKISSPASVFRSNSKGRLSDCDVNVGSGFGDTKSGKTVDINPLTSTLLKADFKSNPFLKRFSSKGVKSLLFSPKNKDKTVSSKFIIFPRTLYIMNGIIY